jgi:hypothetical protein
MAFEHWACDQAVYGEFLGGQPSGGSQRVHGDPLRPKKVDDAS